MTIKRFIFLPLTIILVTLVGACSSDTVSTQTKNTTLEVNDENCKLENIKKIGNKEVREEFGSKCFRRGALVPSKKIQWKL